jgi:hypothetical protein
LITLPKLKGLRQSLMDERNNKIAAYARADEEEEEDEK